MSYSLDFSAVIDRLPELLLACLATIGLAIAGMSLATVIGVLGVVARRSRFKLLRGLVIGFVETIRNTPFLVQIFFIFFALPQIGIKLNPTVAKPGLGNVAATTFNLLGYKAPDDYLPSLIGF